MLTTLQIRNLAIADALEVELGPGLNVITGETGAGKSILVDAVGLVLGGRATAADVRAGAAEAVVEARFEGPELDAQLQALDLPTSSGELVIRRVVSRSGRGKVQVNGALATVGTLAQLARGLCELSGQHDQLGLLDPSTHLGLLDAFAELGPDRLRFGERHAALQAARRARDALDSSQADRARRAATLSEQIADLEALSASEGEEARLVAERKRLSGLERLRALCGAACEVLGDGEGGAVAEVGRAGARVHDAVGLDPALAPISEGLRAGLAELDEVRRGLARYLDGLEADPGRLAEIDDRLDLLRRAARRSACGCDALPALLEALRREHASLLAHAERISVSDAEVSRLLALAEAEATRLRASRQASAARFGRAVRAELARLGMSRTRFEVGMSQVALGPDGGDRVELRIGPNPGEPLQPLAHVASGGELSRILLALKRALAEVEGASTYVFDEVDAGVGGAVAEAVGRMLQGVASHKQVLCVTHLPQVAAFADRHLVVRKQVVRARTVSAVSELRDPGARRDELARMLAGATITDAALAHAAELLSGAAREHAGVVRRQVEQAARRVKVSRANATRGESPPKLRRAPGAAPPSGAACGDVRKTGPSAAHKG